MIVPVPDSVHLELSPRGAPFEIEQAGWSDSGQTRLSFVLLDDDKLVAEGSFTYPGSSKPAEDHADQLLEVLEAGFERGCPHAKLPKRLGKSVSSGASIIDADPSAQVKTARALDRALESLRNRCP